MKVRKSFVLGVSFLFCFITGAYGASYRFGIFPSNDPVKLDAVMKPLGEYLSAVTGDDISIVISSNCHELCSRLKNGSIDLAWLNAVNYVRIRNNTPSIEYLATYVKKDDITGEIQSYSRSYIISMKKNGFSSVYDTEGKVFAFTDKSSTSGYFYPMCVLRDMGIEPVSFFKKVFFLKRHDRVINALISGSVDIGAVSDGTYDKAVRDHGDLFAILAQSPPIPMDALVTSYTFPENRVEAYRKALVDMPRNHPFFSGMRAILGWNSAGFEVRDDSFYDPVRKVSKLDF